MLRPEVDTLPGYGERGLKLQRRSCAGTDGRDTLPGYGERGLKLQRSRSLSRENPDTLPGYGERGLKRRGGARPGCG